MKKLIIAFSAVAIAVGAQAAQFQWSIDGKESMYAMNDSDYYTGTGYLFDTTVISQAALVEAFAGEGFDITSYTALSTGDIDTGDLGATKFNSVDYPNYLNSYYAAILTDGGKDYLYISDAINTQAAETGTPKIKFTPEESSQLPAMDAKAGFNGAGWYSAVPEPTSGLLLLLGVAGLALRRRRA